MHGRPPSAFRDAVKSCRCCGLTVVAALLRRCLGIIPPLRWRPVPGVPQPRDNPASAVAAGTGCTASWRGVQRAHCRACRVTVEDKALFDAHRLTGRCVPPDRLDLVAVGRCGVGC